MQVERGNVGRIAERIAMNELEARGFHIIDLAYMSKTAANVDFIASKGGSSFCVQVKGMSNKPSARWTVQYGYCDEDIVERRRRFYNGKSDYALKADVVVLLAVKAPSQYRAVVLPVAQAEKAAQMNIDGYYRLPKEGGGKRTPSKVWIELEPSARPRTLNPARDAERALLLEHVDAWATLGGLLDEQCEVVRLANPSSGEADDDLAFFERLAADSCP